MSGKPSRAMTKTTPAQATEDVRRYVLDFGPTTPSKELALKSLEEWLANGSKYAGAVLIKSQGSDSAAGDPLFVTAIELSVKVYTTTVGPDDEVGSFVRRNTGSTRVIGPEANKLVLASASREMVSRVLKSALAYSLGESGKDVVLSELQLDYGFGFSEATDYPGRFVELLDEILKGGAKYVEERILQELEREKPGLKGALSFKDAMLLLAELDTTDSKRASSTEGLEGGAPKKKKPHRVFDRGYDRSMVS